MSVEAPEKAENAVTAEPAAAESASGFTDLSESELDALISRVEEARAHELALSGEDYDLLLKSLLTLATMHEQLSHNDLTILKLRKLLGLVSSSEKLKDLLDKTGAKDSRGAGEAEQDSEDSGGADSGGTGSGKPRRRPPRRKSPPVPNVEHHPMSGLCKGDHCPGCSAGRVYKYPPAQLLRITGHSPYSATRHVSERLRCNGCGQTYTAQLPPEVLADGEADQQYGFSARTIMAILKYFAGNPFFRQQSVQGLLGTHVAASTIFDQCELVANALNPVFRAIKASAGDAHLYYLDDTTNRILQQQPVQKSRKGKSRLRTGIYTSACLALVNEALASDGTPYEPISAINATRRIVLFQTNVGHAGEWIEQILATRDGSLASPIIMSDALSANEPEDIEFIDALCNAHGRRGFAELVKQSPTAARIALEHYRHIWANERHCTEHQLTGQARCDYHQEHSLPHMQALHDWCTEQLETEAVERNSNLGKAMAYLVRHYQGLTCFCRVPDAPLDNNEIERLIKLIVRGRKNAFFFQTLVGAEISDVITSILATCNENDVDAFEYLNAVQRNQQAVRASPHEWLPWNYPSGP